jgi:hypothetical protein
MIKYLIILILRQADCIWWRNNRIRSNHGQVCGDLWRGPEDVEGNQHSAPGLEHADYCQTPLSMMTSILPLAWNMQTIAKLPCPWRLVTCPWPGTCRLWSNFLVHDDQHPAPDLEHADCCQTPLSMMTSILPLTWNMQTVVKLPCPWWPASCPWPGTCRLLSNSLVHDDQHPAPDLEHADYCQTPLSMKTGNLPLAWNMQTIAKLPCPWRLVPCPWPGTCRLLSNSLVHDD